MNKLIFVKIIILCSLLISSCKKDVQERNPDFQGEWHAPIGGGFEYYISIDGNQGVYGATCQTEPTESNCESFFTGDAKINRSENKLFIGPWINQVVMNIDVPPHVNTDGDWECTLTKRVYIRD